jgi:hypothetical protein
MFECPNDTVNHQFEFVLRHVENGLKVVFNGRLQELEKVDSVIREAIEVLRDQLDRRIEYDFQDSWHLLSDWLLHFLENSLK